MSESVDVPQFALSVEDFLGPLPAETERLRERAEQFDYLRNVIVVFPVFGAGLRVEEVVARDEFENLDYEVSKRTGGAT